MALLVWNYWQGRFLIDPVKEITTRTGKTALILLLSSLAVTPAVRLTGMRQLSALGRPLGLSAALYAGAHFLTFVGLDYGLDLSLIGDAIFLQRFVVVGFAAGVIMLALAITSARGWQKRLGKNWKRLHYLAYLAGILAIVHFVWLRKDAREPLTYGAVLVALLLMRLPGVRRILRKTE